MFNSVAYRLFIECPALEGQFDEVSRNDKKYIFSELECGLTVEEVAELCLKSMIKVKKWDNFIIRHDRLELPTGQLLTAQQVLIGVALLELGASSDTNIAHQILKYTRILSKKSS